MFEFTDLQNRYEQHWIFTIVFIKQFGLILICKY